LYSGININYMLCPPSNVHGEVTPFYSYLSYAGVYYRIVMIAVGAIISFIMRYIVINIFALTVRILTPYHLHTSYRKDVEISMVEDDNHSLAKQQENRQRRQSSVDKILSQQQANGRAVDGERNGNHYVTTDESSADEEDNPYAAELRKRRMSNAQRPR